MMLVLMEYARNVQAALNAMKAISIATQNLVVLNAQVAGNVHLIFVMRDIVEYVSLIVIALQVFAKGVFV
jgi:hypothetical protein